MRTLGRPWWPTNTTWPMGWGAVTGKANRTLESAAATLQACWRGPGGEHGLLRRWVHGSPVNLHLGSPLGWSVHPWRHSAIPRGSTVGHRCRVGCHWHLAGRGQAAAKVLQGPGQPTQRRASYPAHSNNGTEAGTPPHKKAAPPWCPFLSTKMERERCSWPTYAHNNAGAPELLTRNGLLQRSLT